MSRTLITRWLMPRGVTASAGVVGTIEEVPSAIVMLLRPGLLAVEYKPIASQSPTLQKFAIDTESHLKQQLCCFIRPGEERREDGGRRDSVPAEKPRRGAGRDPSPAPRHQRAGRAAASRAAPRRE